MVQHMDVSWTSDGLPQGEDQDDMLCKIASTMTA